MKLDDNPNSDLAADHRFLASPATARGDSDLMHKNSGRSAAAGNNDAKTNNLKTRKPRSSDFWRVDMDHDW